MHAWGTSRQPGNERQRRRRLMLSGIALAGLLPVIGVALLAKEFDRNQRDAAASATLLADGVEKQLRDRLFLVSEQLDRLSGSTDLQSQTAAASRQTIPLFEVRVEERPPAAGADPAARLWMGPPVHNEGRWRVPLAHPLGNGHWLRAEVNASLFTQVVAGYSLPEGKLLRLLHRDGALLVPSGDGVQGAAVHSMAHGPLFTDPAHVAPSGSYVFRGSRGPTHRMFYRRLSGLPMIIEVGVPRYSVLRQWAPFAIPTIMLSLFLAAAWGWLLIRFDQDQQRQQDLIDELDASRQRLREANALAHMGAWTWYLQDNSIHWSEEVYRIYGRVPDGRPLDIESVFAMIHPEDVPRLREGVQRMLAGTRAMREEYRVLRPDGELRHVQALAALQVEEDGSRKVHGVQQDVTDMVLIRDRVSAAESQYRFLFDHNPLPMWVFDLESLDFLAVNEAMVRHYGYPRERLLEMSLLDIRPAADAEAARKAVKASADQRTPGMVWTHLRCDGTPLRMATQSHDITFGGRAARLVAAHDVTERERNEQRFRLIARATSDAIWDLDVGSGGLWWSDSFYSQFGYDPDEMAPTLEGWEALVHPDDVQRVVSGLDQALAAEQLEWQDTYRFRRKDGSYAEVLDRGFILRDGEGLALRAAGGMLDLTQTLRDQSDLRLLRRAVDSASNGIVIADARQPDQPLVYVNRGFEAISGYTAETMLGRNCRILQGEDRAQPALEALRLALREGSEAQVMLRNYRADGTLFMNEFHLAPVRDEDGTLTHFIGITNDVTQRHHFEEQLAHRATHDELTGLPNRQLLHDRLHQAILNADRYGREAAVIFIDLDDFKLVNDNLGHSAGDLVLRRVAARLLEVVRGTDTVGRFGGDEFVVVLTEQTDADGMNLVIERITSALSQPLDLGGLSHTLTPSIGWCRYPEGGSDAEALLMHADVAMYQAKRRGRNRAVAYRAEFDAHASHRLRLLAELREALRLEQFALVFQPLFDRSGSVVALEALVRWQHPERGLLEPAEFIGVCEESGLIVELGRRVLLEAARHHPLLAQAGLGQLRIAVNVSAVQFEQSLAEDVLAALAAHAMPTGALELELTESVVMHSFERAIAVMQQLAAMGVSFSIDDFGTGHSSLAYLQRLPIDRLKIDRSFVQDLGPGSDDAIICASIIGLAHSLKIATVAEGVETQEQLDWLRREGCDEIQGYLLGRPQPFDVLLPHLVALQRDNPMP